MEMMVLLKTLSLVVRGELKEDDDEDVVKRSKGGEEEEEDL